MKITSEKIDNVNEIWCTKSLSKRDHIDFPRFDKVQDSIK